MSDITKIKQYSEKAKKHIKEIKGNENIDIRNLYFHLREYVKARFWLEEEDVEDESLMALAEKSIANANNISLEEIEELDAPSCTGATAAISKKVLFLVTLEKQLDIKIPNNETVKNDSIENLSKIIYRELFGDEVCE